MYDNSILVSILHCEMIDKIVNHEKEIMGGEKLQTVEIYYKFVGNI